MLKLSEFWSARAHSEDFTLTRMGFMTVRLRLLTCLLMVGLPAWALVDWLTLPATTELLFNTPWQDKWLAATHAMGIDIWRVAPQAGHA